MNNDITRLSPTALWKHFFSLTQIPRPSKKEDQVRAFIYDFGKKLGLETLLDETGHPGPAGVYQRPRPQRLVAAIGMLQLQLPVVGMPPRTQAARAGGDACAMFVGAQRVEQHQSRGKVDAQIGIVVEGDGRREFEAEIDHAIVVGVVRRGIGDRHR